TLRSTDVSPWADPSTGLEGDGSRTQPPPTGAAAIMGMGAVAGRERPLDPGGSLALGPGAFHTRVGVLRTPYDEPSRLLVRADRGRHPGLLERRPGRLDLAAPGLDQQVSAGSEPGRRRSDHPTLHHQTVGATVQGDRVLVVARLARHERDRVGRD